jgi:tetratricopeptide (TPR) repeat protein
MWSLSKRYAVPGLLVGALVLVVYTKWMVPAPPSEPIPRPIGAPGGVATTRAGLDRTIAELEARLAQSPGQAAVAVRLAEALLRQSRVANNPGLAVRAEDALRAGLEAEPAHYEALRMMGTVLLSQHRFHDAIAFAERAQRVEPRDTWNLGVIGDAYLELGDYDRAFDRFDQMMKLRPSAAAYARVSYSRELQGDLEGALRLMRMAVDATTAHDPESQAWHRAQAGDLLFQLGRLDAAEREYRHAAHHFPEHPFAVAGLARVQTARHDYRGALDLYSGLMQKSPLPDLAARIGELHAKLGHTAEAERYYALAENGWRADTPEPTLLARFLATHERKTSDALALAERAASARRDIFTMDALAWASLKAGRLDDAGRASAGALRTGTRDRVLLYHAAAIASAAGDRPRARQLVEQALDGHEQFDPVAAPEAQALRARLRG